MLTTSETASDADASDAGEGAWLSDTDLWGEIAGPSESECAIYEAKLPSAKVPRRTWEKCAEGCLAAPAFLPGQGGAIASAVSATEHQGDIYYHVSSLGFFGVNEVARLSDDAPVAMLRQAAAASLCTAATGFDSPFLFLFFAKGDDAGYRVATVSPEIGLPALWAVPGLESISAFAAFDFDGGWGHIVSHAAVRVALTPGSSEETTIFSSASYQDDAVGRGPLVAWADWTDWTPDSRAKLRGWTQAGGTTVLASGPYDVMYIALSDAKIVWLGATGLNAYEGHFESAGLFWSPFATDPSGITIHDGPQHLPHTEYGTGRLTTYGELAALRVGWETGSGPNDFATAIVVANLVTGKVWEIPERPGQHFDDVMAMNATTLLVKEFATNVQMTDRIVRLDLAHLNELAAGWSQP